MKNKMMGLMACAALLMMTSCMGQHNKAPSKGVNLDNDRIYGDKGGDPRQLATKWGEDTGNKVALRADSIRQKLYPR